MVPLYQILLDVLVAGSLLLLAAYHPLILKRPLPRWSEVALVGMAGILAFGVTFAVVVGH